MRWIDLVRVAASLALAITLAPGCGQLPGNLGEGGVAAGVASDSVATAGRSAEPRHYYDVLGSDRPAGAALQALSSEIDLAGVALDAQSSTPGHDVVIRNVPTDRGKIRVAILDSQGQFHTWAMLRDLGQLDRIALMTPVLPAGVAPEGNVTLVVSVRGVRAAPLSLHVDPLPPPEVGKGARAALTALSEMAASDAIFGDATSSIGVLVHELFGDPSNPASLLSALGSLEASDSALADAMDRVLATTGVVDSLAEHKRAAERLSAALKGSQGASYRLQAFAEPASDLSFVEAVGLMRRQKELANTFRSSDVDLRGRLSAAIASLRSAEVSKTLISEILNANAVALRLQDLYLTSTLPDKVELSRPEVRSACSGTDGLTYFGEDSPCSRGYWSVRGQISNSPIALPASAIRAALTAASEKADEIAYKLGARFLVVMADKDARDAAESLRQKIVIDETANTITIGSPRVFYAGDMTLYSKVSGYSSNAAFGPGTMYRLLDGSGYLTFSVSINPDFFAGAMASREFIGTLSRAQISVTIEQPSVALPYVDPTTGDLVTTRQLTARVMLGGIVEDHGGVRWETSDPSRVVFDGPGLVRVVATQTTAQVAVHAISLTDPKKKGSATISISPYMRLNGPIFEPIDLYSYGSYGWSVDAIPGRGTPSGDYSLRVCTGVNSSGARSEYSLSYTNPAGGGSVSGVVDPHAMLPQVAPIEIKWGANNAFGIALHAIRPQQTDCATYSFTVRNPE
ncbi:MAG: hypothetical protein FJZ01_27055 [Candidatus Sericytochromatia bacterium]|nr:hypothetical protein [Candidatus Tanganyikabacteria bacterium]